MFAKTPGIIPEKMTDAGYLNNPLGGLPYPQPSNMPAAVWDGGNVALTFTTSGLPSGVFARAVWRSPVFDLRPYFRGLMDVAGTQRNTGTQPIWLPGGGTGKLWFQVGGLLTRTWGTLGLRVTSVEYASPRDANDPPAITVAEDITTEFVSGAPTALGTFLPPGAGYPVRFYAAALTFDFLIDSSAEPDWPSPGYWLAAAYY